MGEFARDIFDLLAARHERKDFDAALLPAPKASGDLALDQHHESVARGHRVMRIVRNEDDAHALVLGVIDKPQNGRRFLDAKSRGRLVEDQHLRAEIHCSADRENLALAAGQGPDQLIAITHSGDAKFPYLLESDAVASFGVEPAERRLTLFQLRAKEEIVSHAHER